MTILVISVVVIIVVIFVALYFTVQLQKRGGEDEGWLRETLPAYAGARART